MYAKIFHVSTNDLRICAKNTTNDYYKKLKNPIVVFSAHISKNSTTGCFAPCAETPNLDQYIPPSSQKEKPISAQMVKSM